MNALAAESSRRKAQLESLRELVSPRTGILRWLELRIKGANEPPLPVIYDGWLSHFDFHKADATQRGSCGKGMTEDEAMLGAVGEAIERYCASHVPIKQTRRARAADLAGAILPTEFVLYSRSQYAREGFPFQPWEAEAELLWIKAMEFGSDQPVWVPASLAYLAQPGDQPQDFLCTSTSSGFAAGPDLEWALRNAILELLEREAFMITWLNRLRVPEIDYSASGGVTGEIRSAFQRWGTEVRAFNLATDMPVSAVMVVALDQTGNGPAAVVGLGCELHPERALRKALFEICQVHESFRRRCGQGVADRLNAYSDVSTLEHHAAYFFRRDHLPELEFLLKPARNVRLEEVPVAGGGSTQEDLEVLQGGLSRAGCRIFFRNLTTPDLLPYPIRVVRALITGIQPVHFGHSLERLGGQRLYELPVKTGFMESPASETSLNACPHPLA
jgi:ribosomal protein S12 methylthiotransferase accessory factor